MGGGERSPGFHDWPRKGHLIQFGPLRDCSKAGCSLDLLSAVSWSFLGMGDRPHRVAAFQIPDQNAPQVSS